MTYTRSTLSSHQLDSPITITPAIYYEWNGSLYPTLDAQRRAQLEAFIEDYPTVNATNLIDLLLPHIDTLIRSNPIHGWQTRDGKFFLSLDQAIRHDCELN